MIWAYELQITSMKFAMQDLNKQQKQREEQLKHLDPKKAQQVERLGMGIGVRA
jgi:ADP-ribosylation factor GTPase-activating protein 2/3